MIQILHTWFNFVLMTQSFEILINFGNLHYICLYMKVPFLKGYRKPLTQMLYKDLKQSFYVATYALT